MMAGVFPNHSLLSSAGKRKGVISFILAAVFLLAIIPAAALVSKQEPDLSFESFRAMLVSEIAIKQAFYKSSSFAAEGACAIAISIGVPPEPLISAGLLANAELLQSSLRAQGFETEFWCGAPDSELQKLLGSSVPVPISEQMRRDASGRMMESGSVKSPDGTLPLEFCLMSFQPGLNGTTGTLHFNSFGFSLYDRKSGFGKAVVFPSQKGVEFVCA